jgi:peptide/nickel transport system permease protein
MSTQLETVHPEIAGRSPGQIALMRFKRNKIGVGAAIVSITILGLSAFAPIVCRILGIDPNTLNLEALDTSGVPIPSKGGISLEHPLGLIPGTGRDLLAQLLYGSRISFLVAFLTTALALTVGLFVGIVGGYFRGKVDDALGRFTDFFLAFPAFFMIVALSTPVVQRIQSWNIGGDNFARIVFLIFFLSFFGWPGFSRLIRSQVLSIRERYCCCFALTTWIPGSRIGVLLPRARNSASSLNVGNLALQRFPLCDSDAELLHDRRRLTCHCGLGI